MKKIHGKKSEKALTHGLSFLVTAELLGFLLDSYRICQPTLQTESLRQF